MINPYEVLGIKEGATTEEIKTAYRTQVKKYHPDKYQDNPLYELAEEKLQEVNEAYEMLTKDGGKNGSSYRSTSGGNGGQSQDFRDVRSYIDKGNLGAAEAALGRSSVRNAEWFYLSGILSMKKGWYDDAMNSLQTACSMDPANYEYRNAMNSMMQTSQGYQTNAYSRGFGGGTNDELCRMLQCYCCADALCNCF